jgi:hypothetical protein
MLQGTLLLVLALTLVALLLIAIFRFNPMPLLRRLAVLTAQNQVVNFADILPEKYELQQIYYQDTDGDGDREWVVFYQFDLVDGRSPYHGAVYDYDRGQPPALFPYRLLPPDRDWLSELLLTMEREEVVTTGEVDPTRELLVWGTLHDLPIELTIFRHIPNTLPWEPPRDEPRRYQVIGFFRGDAGVAYDRNTKRVTVHNRAGYERSQLAVQTVYALDEVRGTYMSPVDPEQLGAPVSSQVMFAFGVPDNLFHTPYPEKIVLGFYEMLEEADPRYPPRDFLTGQALVEFDRNNLAYFGLGHATPGNVQNVQVKTLGYVPEIEEFNPLVNVLGEQPRAIVVSVDLEARVGEVPVGTDTPIQWVVTLVNGQWKIDHRL